MEPDSRLLLIYQNSCMLYFDVNLCVNVHSWYMSIFADVWYACSGGVIHYIIEQ